MSTRQSLKLVAIILVLLSAAAAIMPAYAQDAPDLPSTLTLDPVGVQPIGTPITVMAHLKDSDGGPNPNKVLNLYLDDVFVRRTRTDDKGAASIRIGNDLTAGKYALRIDFQGTQAYLPSSISTTLIVRPAELTVNIIPPLANIPFSLNGQKFISDDKGVARLAVYKAGDFPLDVLLDADTEVSPDTRVTFDRWQDEYQPRRTVTIKGDVSIEAGFNVSHPVSQAFVDLSNNPVDMSRIETLTLQGTDGSKLTFDDGSERWLRAGRIARRQTGLEATQIMYSVESVMINGSNTVNRYQQRFFVKPNSVWPIQLLLYHATFRAEDAVFGFHIGKGINVKYPDGHIEYMPFGKDNQISIGPVPRGVYKVQVIGASGMAPETPLALSRNQELDLKVLSSLNIGLAAALGMVGVFGLLIYGRPYLPLLAFRTTRDIVTLRFLRKPAPKPALLTANVQYLLPEATVIQPVEAALTAAPLLTMQPEVVDEAVEEHVSSEPTPLFDNQPVALVVSEPAIIEPSEKTGIIGSTYPGYLGVQDSYHVGTFEGIGDVYQQTYIDVYSGVALVKLYDRKDSRVAADMLNKTVLPWFKQHGVVIKRVMTDRGREYLGTGQQKKHKYQAALASVGIEYVKNDSKDPQSNDICAALHQTMRKEVYNKALAKHKKQGMSLEALQQAVDAWLNVYNSEHLLNGEGQGKQSSISSNTKDEVEYVGPRVSGAIFAS